MELRRVLFPLDRKGLTLALHPAPDGVQQPPERRHLHDNPPHHLPHTPPCRPRPLARRAAGGGGAGPRRAPPRLRPPRDPRERTQVANSGWQRWTPVNLAAIGAHLVGGAGLLLANKGRVGAQKGVMSSTIAKTALTGAALAATAYSRALGEKVIRSNAPS